MKIYSDGFASSKACGYYVVNEKGKILKKNSFLSGTYTNNETEYMGFIRACYHAKIGDTIITDSQLIVNQVSGKWKVKHKHLQYYVDMAKKFVRIKKLNYEWLKRDKNLAGIIIEQLEG
jgi:ribonuclease HI